MTFHRALPTVSLAVALALGIAGCGGGADSSPDAASATSSSPAGDSTATQSDSMESATGTAPASASGDAMMTPGRYLTLEQYRADPNAAKAAHIVFFFHAPWCPDCRATDASLTTDGVPDGLTVVKVDYDTETELRQKYGITQQHTFVLVDPEGMQQKTWTGSKSGAEILAETT